MRRAPSSALGPADAGVRWLDLTPARNVSHCPSIEPGQRERVEFATEILQQCVLEDLTVG